MTARVKSLHTIVSDIEASARMLEAAADGLRDEAQNIGGPTPAADLQHRRLAIYYERVEAEAADLRKCAEDLRQAARCSTGLRRQLKGLDSKAGAP